MITTLVGIQTICACVAAYFTYKTSLKAKVKKPKLKVVKKHKNGFKHYRA
jgi:hypothetical protein